MQYTFQGISRCFQKNDDLLILTKVKDFDPNPPIHPHNIFPGGKKNVLKAFLCQITNFEHDSDKLTWQ